MHTRRYQNSNELRAGSALNLNVFSAPQFFLFLKNRRLVSFQNDQKRRLKKFPKNKKLPFAENLFFSPHSRSFFFRGNLSNRSRLADLGGVEPLRTWVTLKLRCGRDLKSVGPRLSREVQLLRKAASVGASCMLVQTNMRCYTHGS